MQNLESLASNSQSPADQLTEMARRATADRTRYTQELVQLRGEIDQLKAEKATISQRLDDRDSSVSMHIDFDKDEVSRCVLAANPRSQPVLLDHTPQRGATSGTCYGEEHFHRVAQRTEPSVPGSRISA